MDATEGGDLSAAERERRIEKISKSTRLGVRHADLVDSDERVLLLLQLSLCHPLVNPAGVRSQYEE